jgi:hypothetical protein
MPQLNLYVTQVKHQQHHSETPVHKLQVQYTDKVQTAHTSALKYVNSKCEFCQRSR